MVGRQHHMMPREAAADIAKQYELSEHEQVDLIGQVKFAGKVCLGLPPRMFRETFPSGCQLNVLAPLFRKLRKVLKWPRDQRLMSINSNTVVLENFSRRAVHHISVVTQVVEAADLTFHLTQQ